jgi:NAD(P)-dependent dehydrogenase (short-subunit alcohol dehydrogenase family)
MSSAKETGMFDLSGRVAVVTGGNGGIGLGIARGLAKAGAAIAIWARDTAKSEAAVKELEALGARALALPCDVADEAQVAAAAEQTVAALGRIDVGVANAGGSAVTALLETSLADWQKLTRVDLDGVFLTFREIARHMVARGGGGRLIAISSIGEIFGMPRQAAYAASKGGLGALVRSLAVELARHDIQVNAVQPGWIATEPLKPLMKWKVFNDTILHRTPARRWGTPDDLAGACVYLASDAARFHTGDTLRVDGGYSVF